MAEYSNNRGNIALLFVAGIALVMGMASTFLYLENSKRFRRVSMDGHGIEAFYVSEMGAHYAKLAVGAGTIARDGTLHDNPGGSIWMHHFQPDHVKVVADSGGMVCGITEFEGFPRKHRVCLGGETPLRHYDPTDIDGDGTKNAGSIAGAVPAQWNDLTDNFDGLFSGGVWAGDGSAASPYRMHLNGTNSGLDAGTLNYTSLSVWFRPLGDGFVFSYGSMGADREGATSNSKRLEFSWSDAVGIPYDRWHHLAYVCDGGNSITYLNGLKFNGSPCQRALEPTQLLFGRNVGGTVRMKMDLGEIRAYGRKLTEQEIIDIYEKTRPDYFGATSSTKIERVTPTIGPLAMGTAITVVGWNLNNVVSIQVGGVAATNLVRLTDHRLSFTAPPETSLSSVRRDIRFLLADGSDIILPRAFEYSKTYFPSKQLLVQFEASNYQSLGSAWPSVQNLSDAWYSTVGNFSAVGTSVSTYANQVMPVFIPPDSATAENAAVDLNPSSPVNSGGGRVMLPSIPINSFSEAFWFYSRQSRVERNLLENYSETSAPRVFWSYGSIISFVGHENLELGGAGAVSNRWHHVVITNMASQTNFYLDGEWIDNVSGNLSRKRMVQHFGLGITSPQLGTQPARINDFRIYRHALDENEVFELWEEGRMRRGPAATLANGYETSLKNAFGPLSGGNLIQIYTYSNEDISSVSFGGTAGTNLTKLGPHRFQVQVPSRASVERVDVAILYQGGSLLNLPQAYRYTDTNLSGLKYLFDTATPSGAGFTIHLDRPWQSSVGRQTAALHNFPSPHTATSGWQSPAGERPQLVFDGVDDTVALGTLKGIRSMAIWLKVDSLGTILTSIGCATLQVGASGKLQASMHQPIPGSPPIELNISMNTWFHLAMVHVGGTTGTKFYINGLHVSSQTGSTGAPFNMRRALIGSQFSNSFQGAICEARFYSSVLTDTEVQDLYNRTNGIICGSIS